MEIVTSWERKGMEKGFEIGMEQGIEIGMEQSIAALQSVVLDVLLSRFGILDASITSRVRALNSLEGLRNLTHKALTAGCLRELEF